MKKLTEIQKEIITEMCNVQLNSLGNIFLNDEDYVKREFFENDPELELEDFYDTLIQTANFYKNLKDDPEIYLPKIDPRDADVLMIIFNYWRAKTNIQSEEVDALAEYIQELIYFGDKPNFEEPDLETALDEISHGEDNEREFKPSLLYHFTKQKGSRSTLYEIAKPICGFLNSNGGVLYIGVRDDMTIKGLEADYSLFKGDENKKRDLFRVTFDNLIKHYFGSGIHPLVKLEILNFDGKDFGYVQVAASSSNPVFLRNRRRNPETGKYDIIQKEFFFRADASTFPEHDIEEIIKYVKNKWWNNQ